MARRLRISRRIVAVVVAVLMAALAANASPTGAEPFEGTNETIRNHSLVFAAGSGHTCAIDSDAQLRCWGAASFGQLGQGNQNTIGDGPGEMGSNLPPIDLGTGRTTVAVGVGSGFTCALLDDGSVKCWGDNPFGILGIGKSQGSVGAHPDEMGDNLPPIDLGTGRTAVAISVGGGHTCALLDNHDLKCWGFNTAGGLGQGDSLIRGGDPDEMGDNLPPIDLGTGRTAVAVSAGGGTTCAILDNGDLKCWGANREGQMGQGYKASSLNFGPGSELHIGDAPGEMGDNLPPVDLGTGRTAVAVSASSRHICAILDNGELKCWGAGYDGRTGRGDSELIGDEPGEMGDNLPPVDLGTGRTAIAVSTGQEFTCALLDNGTVKCFGWNFWGQLGQGHTDDIGDDPGEMGDSLPPVDLGTGRTAVAISAGSQFACALLDNSELKCWGNNAGGQLGQGNFEWVGDDPAEMGDNLPAIDIPSAGGPWLDCHDRRPTGYWLGEADGTIYPFGDADTLGNTTLASGTTLVDTEATPTGCGYWTLRADGAIGQFGDAPDLGDLDLGSLTAGENLASFSPTPTGQGLWAFTDRGRVLT
ncbi:MAG TPA: hypothetical protein ENI86_04480, partial [Acidimicrobiales bacterium]|nr:hypothetical protein [Acidimicrobiales bacterium]